jgi:glucose/arabinose dehydrogenase
MRTRRLIHRPRILTLVMLTAFAVSIAAPSLTSAASYKLVFARIATGLAAPTQVTNAGDGTNRLFIVEKRGTIRVLGAGGIQPGYFMDIRSIVADSGEQGLLGVAFHPDFETNRTLFVYYTRNGGDIVVSRYTTNAAGTNVDETVPRPLLVIEHSANTNHNGGALAFGPNGYLYMGVGDGGGGGDPLYYAQKKNVLLGKILRIDVNGTGAGPYDRYSIPADNPYAGATPGLDEIWAIGLRNPWRISFDRASGRLFIADVGQSRYEEIDRETTATGGKNYGWSAMEGKHCFKPSRCPLAGDTLPVAEYSHAGGNCSVTGGFVYRGTLQPALIGQYVFADFCSGRVWTMPYAGLVVTLRADTSLMITSFGENEGGELYAVTIAGVLYRVKVA